MKEATSNEYDGIKEKKATGARKKERKGARPDICHTSEGHVEPTASFSCPVFQNSKVIRLGPGHFCFGPSFEETKSPAQPYRSTRATRWQDFFSEKIKIKKCRGHW